MGLASDFMGIFKKHTLQFLEIRYEVGDVVTFLFKPQDTINWKVGQHGIFFFQNVKLEGGSSRAFSIASILEEEVIQISMRISNNPSAFKKELLSLKLGDLLVMRGPIGSFSLNHTMRHAVFIAGGIGITPFRALLQEAVKYQKVNLVSIDLLYSQDEELYVYKEEIDAMAQSNPFINVQYINNKESLFREVAQVVEKYKNNGAYFISGAPIMIKSVKTLLIGQGIKKKLIKSDPFMGYSSLQKG